MSIKWNIPADLFSNNKFVYTAPSANSNNPFGPNPFGINIFNGQTNFPQMPALVPFPAIKTPLFNFKTNTTQNKNYSFSKGISLLGENQNSSIWTNLGYNSQKGYELAENAASNARGFTGNCARYVKTAIANTGLGEYKSGNACDMIGILRQNKQFKEISPNGVDLKKLPAGCVLVYGAGVGGYSSKYGHTEITTGNGKAISDGVTNNLYKTPTSIFMPVAA